MTGRKGWDIDLRDGKMAEGTIAGARKAGLA
jgi:hypothetical protein